MIKLKNINKIYKIDSHNVLALSDINIDFNKGDRVLLNGNSGSGKSTLLNIIGCFDNDFIGTYHIDGYDINKSSNKFIDKIRSEKIGFIFQEDELINSMSVIENIELSMAVIGVENKKIRRATALDTLDLLGLLDKAYVSPRELSGGERKRVGIARAIIKEPDIIIADEPTASLNESAKEDVLSILVELCKDKILIIASHDDITTSYVNKTITLDSGFIVKTGESRKHSKTSNVVTSNLLNKMKLNFDSYKQVDNVKDNTISKVEDINIEKKKYKDKLSYSLNLFKEFKWSNLFTSLIISVSLLAIIVSLTYSLEVFKSYKNESGYIDNFYNNKEVIEFDNGYLKTNFEDNDLYNMGVNDYVSQFSREDIESNDFFNELFKDQSFNFKYQKELFDFLKEYLSNENIDYNIYYDNFNLIQSSLNKDIILDDFQDSLYNMNKSGSIYSGLTGFMGYESNSSLNSPFNYLYSNTNEDIIEDYLVGGRLPKNSSEVVVPISYLTKFNILEIDEDIVDINDIYNKFDKLENSMKYLNITSSMIVEDLLTDYKVVLKESRFEIVGLIGVDNVNPHLNRNYRNNIDNNYNDYLSLIFNNDASNKINIIKEYDGNDISIVPSYIELSKSSYENYNIDMLIDNFYQEYKDRFIKSIVPKIKSIYEKIDEGMVYTKALFDFHLSNDISELPVVINNNVEDLEYSNLKYDELLKVYLTYSTIDNIDSDTLGIMCSECSTVMNFTDVYNHSMKIYDNVIKYNDSNGLLDDFNSKNSITYKKTLNYIMYKYFVHSYNNQFQDSKSSKIQDSDVNIYEFFSIENNDEVNLFDDNEIISGFNNVLNLDITDRLNINFIVSISQSGFKLSQLVLSQFLLMSIIVCVTIVTILMIVNKLLYKVSKSMVQNRSLRFKKLTSQGVNFKELKKIANFEVLLIIFISYLFFIIFMNVFGFISENIISVDVKYIKSYGVYTRFDFSNIFELDNFVIYLSVILLYMLFYKFMLSSHFKKIIKI